MVESTAASYARIVRAVPPIAYVGFGVAIGTIVSVYFGLVSLSGDMANLLGGIVGPGLGAFFGVRGAMYADGRKAEATAQEAEALAGAQLEATLNDAEEFIDFTVFSVSEHGEFHPLESSSSPREVTDSEVAERAQQAIADCQRIAEALKTGAPTARTFRAIRALQKSMNDLAQEIAVVQTLKSEEKRLINQRRVCSKNLDTAWETLHLPTRDYHWRKQASWIAFPTNLKPTDSIDGFFVVEVGAVRDRWARMDNLPKG